MHASARVLAEIFIRTASIYLVILIGVRLSGKREVGQMTPFDLTLLLLLSNAVQNAMTGPDTSLTGGVVAACTLLLMNYLVAEVSGMNRRFRRFVQGSPTLLIHDGQLLPANLSREHLTVDEVGARPARARYWQRQGRVAGGAGSGRLHQRPQVRRHRSRPPAAPAPAVLAETPITACR